MYIYIYYNIYIYVKYIQHFRGQIHLKPWDFTTPTLGLFRSAVKPSAAGVPRVPRGLSGMTH